MAKTKLETKKTKTPQTVTKKKDTVKKPATKKKTIKKATQKEIKTRKELTDLINQINEEGLLFLKQQASVLIHNQTVEEQKKDREKKEKASQKSGKGSTTNNKNLKSPGSKPIINIKIEPGPNMTVFYIVTDMTRGFFNKNEFKSIVKLCQNTNGKMAAKKTLYTWLRKERGDFLQDAQIETLDDIRMELIVDAILKDYKI